MAFYPLYIDIERQKCIVVGGGVVAERKVLSLVECGADVEVVSPEFTSKLNKLAEDGSIKIKKRGFEPGDLEGAVLAIVATNDHGLNKEIYHEAKSSNIPVNIVDVPELCSFIVPSTIRRGDLIISISTSGSCPALAKSIRKQLQQVFGDEYAQYCGILRDFRNEIAERYEEPERRKQALERLIESDIVGLLKEGKFQEAEERVRSCM